MSSDDRRADRALLAAPWLAAGLLALGLYYGLQRRTFARLLRFESLELVGDETWLLSATFIATDLLLLTAVAVVASLVGRWQPWSRARLVFVVGAAFVGAWLSLDADVLSSVGRHVAEVGRIALLPEGHQAGGDLGTWVRTTLLWLSLSGVWALAVMLASEWFVASVAAKLTPLLRWVLASTLVLVTLAAGLVPHAMHPAWKHQGLLERLYAAQVLDLRIGVQAENEQAFDDPVLGAIAPELGRAYRASFATLMTAKDVDRQALPIAAPAPNVILIVAESLRHDVFTPELMPRLSAWARAGSIAAHHDSGTMYSESGMFALLYGRSPIVYHPTLDAKVPPQLCVTLRQSGYECAYFTGHPKVWNRREEYLNAQTMDRFVHDARGDWPDWDRTALANMVRAAQTADKPLFALVFLMSSHFEYRYPKAYERDLPVSTSKWRDDRTRSLGDADEIPVRNRYRNCMRFVDDVVADAIGQLDPSRNLIVFTGDHGESINDDGTFTHGYSFSEITTRTPLAIVGPGVPVSTLTGLTEHRDLVSTVAGLLSGAPTPIAHTHGRDWFHTDAPNSALVAYATQNQDLIKVQLRSKSSRLRFDLGSRKPSVVLFGFEDEYGHFLQAPRPSAEDVARMTAAFHRQLETLLR